MVVVLLEWGEEWRVETCATVSFLVRVLKKDDMHAI